VRKAEADYRLAAKLAKGDESFHDQLCFHCQQAAEKYLKALLQELGLTVPRTHMLRDLVDLIVPHHGELNSLRRGAKFLTRFAVEARYPGESASKREAEAALRWAGRVRETARRLLGIRKK
jgi:HEPN domain-containing protein